MPRQTHLRILLLLVINYSLLVNLQAQSWQFSKKLGSDKKYTPNDVPVLLDKLKDSKGNHYLYYYITGDTFYYDDFSHKRYLRGGDGYALCKIRCDGSLAWSKIFTHDRKNKVDLTVNAQGKIFFGDNENRIVISGIAYTYGTYFHIDNDTAISNLKEFTIIYDSLGVAIKKSVGKPTSQGRSIATGYFPYSRRFFYYGYIDSTATDRVFYKGKFLQRGEYFMVLDSNMNYLNISPVTLFTKPRSLIDASDPLELAYSAPHIMPFCIINHKVIILNASAFRPNDMYIGKYAAVGKDTFRIYDNLNNRLFNIFMCYNDTGGQEWTEFFYELASGNVLSKMILDKNEIFLLRDDFGKFSYQGDEINSSLPNGNYQAVVFKIDSNGKFLWKDSIEHSRRVISSSDNEFTSKHELTWNFDLFSDYSSPGWVNIQNKTISNNTPTPLGTSYTKNLVVAVGKGTQRVIDTTTEGIRRTLTTHVSVDAADNVWLFGSKEIDGRILNNDSTPLQYGTGNDLFIAKYGQAHCFCDPLVSSYKVLDSSIEGRISLQYTGSATDSVVFLWGDGTHSVAKPSSTPLTKIYNKTISASIAAVVYNNCYRRDTFRRTIQIKCTPPNAEFVLLDSNTKNIRIKYIGTAADTVTYQWGDGNTTKLANPLNKITSYNYTTSVDSVYISAKIKSVCGDRDTFARWYVFCPKPKKSFILDTSKLNSRILSVQYTSADSLWVHWGDGMISYKPSGIKIYNSYGVYTISIILKSSCGSLDTTRYILTVGTSSTENSNIEDIIVSPNPVIDKCSIQGISSIKPIEFTIYDLMGKNVLHGKTTGVIDLSTLSNGNYILTLLNEKYSHVVKHIEVRK